MKIINGAKEDFFFGYIFLDKFIRKEEKSIKHYAYYIYEMYF